MKQKVWNVIHNPVTDQYLLARRSSKVNRAGMWNFFGGNIDEHETPLVAAYRELHEEAKLRLVLFRHHIIETTDSTGEPVQSFYFKAQVGMVFPKLNFEHDIFGWFSKRLLDETPLHPYTHSYFNPTAR